MRAQFGRPKLGIKAPQSALKALRAVGRRLRVAWTGFRNHSLFVTMIAYYAIILGAFYMAVGSELMLGSFIGMVAVLFIALVARLSNGWRLIMIAFCHGALCLLIVRGLEALGVTGLSELVLFQITIPLPLGCAWVIDRDERDLATVEQPVAQ